LLRPNGGLAVEFARGADTAMTTQKSARAGQYISRSSALFGLIVVIALLCGCSVKRTAVRYAGGIIETGLPVYFEENDIQTAKETMLSGLKFAEVLLKNDPKNKTLPPFLAQGYCGYAFLFVEDTDRERASELYLKGAGFARKLIPAGRKISAGDVPAVFWNAFCRAGYIQLNLDKPDALADIKKVEELAGAALSADPSYYHNGAHSLLGSLAGARPPLLGGNPESSKKHFEAALKGAGAAFQANRLMYAKTYAVQTQNRELFEKLLKEAAAGENSLPEEKLANKIAAEKAKKLLEKADELF